MTTSADCTARAAAQLREAARDVALVAERRSHRDGQPGAAQRGAGTASAGYPGRLMGLVAAWLAAAGFEVRHEDGDGRSRLDIGCNGARCTAWAGESGHAEWEWRPAGAAWADPKQAADLATVLLCGADSDLTRRGDGYGRPGMTFKGVVATELAARGLSVHLGIYEDQRNYDVTAEVMVANPASAGASTVCVTDSGTLTWAWDYQGEPSASPAPPGGERPDGEPEAATARMLSKTVIRAMTRAGLAPGPKAIAEPGESA